MTPGDKLTVTSQHEPNDLRETAIEWLELRGFDMNKIGGGVFDSIGDFGEIIGEKLLVGYTANFKLPIQALVKAARMKRGVH